MRNTFCLERYRRFGCLAVLWAFLCMPLYAQVQFKSVSADSFPSVKLVATDRNPVSHNSDFFIVEDGANCTFTFASKPAKPDDQGLSILVVMENHYLPQRAMQREFFKGVLSNAVSGMLGAIDEMAVVTFDWYRNDQLLYPAQPEFTNKPDVVKEKVNAITAPSALANQNQGSEIFLALHEALSYFEKYKTDKKKIILLLSDEYYNIFDTRQTAGSVSDKAVALNIPIYSLRYDIGMKDKYTIKDVVDASFGETMWTDGNNAENVVQQLIKFIKNAPQRLAGSEYTISYTAASSRDGKNHSAVLKTKTGQSILFSYTAPPPTFADRFEENKLLFILLGVAFIGLIFAGFKWNKARVQRIAAEEALRQKNLKSMQEKQRQAEEKIAAQDRHLENIVRQTEEEKRKQQEEERRKHEQEREKQLIHEMRARGSFARIVTAKEFGGVLEINKPEIIIGREAGADIVFAHNTVSRKHAVVTYEGGKYYIRDLNSSNGVKVNGTKISGTHPLNDADHVLLGDVAFTFHL
jgi:hypothetical protein